MRTALTVSKPQEVRRLQLKEYEPSDAIELSHEQISALRKLGADIQISPADGPGYYELVPGSKVGVIGVPGLTIEIKPKLPITKIMHMISFALQNQELWPEQPVDVAQDADLAEAIIPAFHTHVRRATRTGLLHGYRSQNDSLNVLRGRIRVDEQLRRRFGIPIPLEVQYDEFTTDIDENRLLKAAVQRLVRLRLRSSGVQTMVGELVPIFSEVASVEFDQFNLPPISISPLNRHYWSAIELARLILQSKSFDLADGGEPAVAFLIDMNKVFEDFVVISLREALDLSEHVFCQGSHRATSLALADDRRIRLVPDMSWFEEGKRVFLGDVKYKNNSKTVSMEPPNTDIYQALAYTVAADVPSALLVYAKGETDPMGFRIPHADKFIEVVALDLSGSLEQIDNQVQALADTVRRHRRRFDLMHANPVGIFN